VYTKFKDMRLTVHVADAKKEKVEVKSKQDPKTMVMKSILKNTFSFTEIEESDVNRILKELEAGGLTPTKYYTSSDRHIGRAFCKKKK